MNFKEQMEQNIKYRYMKDSIDRIRDLSPHLFQQIGIPYYIREYNVICAGGTRQSGKTLMMRHLFNPSKDIFVGYSLEHVRDFKEDKYEINTGEHLHTWTKAELAEMKSRDALLSVNSNNLVERVLDALVEDSVVYLDVESLMVVSNQHEVNKIIESIGYHFERTCNARQASSTIIIYT